MEKPIILLLQPPILTDRNAKLYHFLPLGLAYLSGYLKKFVPEIYPIILDAVAEGGLQQYHFIEDKMVYGLTPDKIRRHIKSINPTIVGITCKFTNRHDMALLMCQITKEVDERIITVLGGSHASAVPEEFLAYPSVDYVVRCPVEKTLADLVRCSLGNGDTASIPSLAFRDKESGRIVPSCLNPPHVDINEIPFPDYSSLDMGKYESLRDFFPTPTGVLAGAPDFHRQRLSLQMHVLLCQRILG